MSDLVAIAAESPQECCGSVLRQASSDARADRSNRASATPSTRAYSRPQQKTNVENKVLFGQSYYLRFDPKLWRAMQPYPPLGTLYAAATLRDRGYDVALFDAMLAGSEEQWGVTIDRERPRFAVIYEDNFNYLSKMCLLRMRQAAFRMIDMARARSCTVIVCGSDVTDHSEQYLERGAHFALIGEGEETLSELLDRLTGRSTTELEKIAGLQRRNGDGQVVSTGPRPVMRDLDALPRPAWDLVDIARYRSIWRQRHGYFSINMATTRGCPFHCNWCAKPIWGQTYQVRSAADVVDEMKFLKSQYGIDHIWFADDILGLEPGWLEKFAECVDEQDARVPYKCLSRVDLVLRPGEIEALRRSGCEIVWVGAESGSQKILDAMEKGTRVEQIHEAARRLRAAGIRVGFFLQFGYPGETGAEIEMTRKLVRQCAPDEIGISVSYPLPGTKFYERVKGQLEEKRNWVDSDDLEMIFVGPFGTAFYRKLHLVVQKEFRCGKAAGDLWAAIRHPSKLRDRGLRWLLHRLAAAAFHLSTLPIERLRLRRLGHLPHPRATALPARMTRAEAATPTPQSPR
ncbi:MAG: B12-binding domain-containing radical SAM protein [Acidobacteriota bacterium]